MSQEDLGRWEEGDAGVVDCDVILVDESHNFRNSNAQRYQNLERLIAANGGRGRDGGRKKVLLLTATPINNDLIDLYNQINLFTRGDQAHFAAAGIGDLHRYFLNARRVARQDGSAIALFNLLEEVVIRRTRPFIRRAYPDATICGEKIAFPERRLKTVQYDLEATYAGIYDQVVHGIDDLCLAPYNLEAYKKAGVKRDDFEAGREQALVGIFKSRYLKRFEPRSKRSASACAAPSSSTRPSKPICSAARFSAAATSSAPCVTSPGRTRRVSPVYRSIQHEWKPPSDSKVTLWPVMS